MIVTNYDYITEYFKVHEAITTRMITAQYVNNHDKATAIKSIAKGLSMYSDFTTLTYLWIDFHSKSIAHLKSVRLSIEVISLENYRHLFLNYVYTMNKSPTNYSLLRLHMSVLSKGYCKFHASPGRFLNNPD